MSGYGFRQTQKHEKSECVRFLGGSVYLIRVSRNEDLSGTLSIKFPFSQLGGSCYEISVSEESAGSFEPYSFSSLPFKCAQ